LQPGQLFRWIAVPADGGREDLELRAPHEPAGGPRRDHVGQLVPGRFEVARRLPKPGVARHLARDLEHHEL
jgi:hypothetical protein